MDVVVRARTKCVLREIPKRVVLVRLTKVAEIASEAQ